MTMTPAQLKLAAALGNAFAATANLARDPYAGKMDAAQIFTLVGVQVMQAIDEYIEGKKNVDTNHTGSESAA